MILVKTKDTTTFKEPTTDDIIIPEYRQNSHVTCVNELVGQRDWVYKGPNKNRWKGYISLSDTHTKDDHRTNNEFPGCPMSKTYFSTQTKKTKKEF